jgi:hypothetical protein
MSLAVFHERQLLRKFETYQQIFTVFSPAALGNEKLVQSGVQRPKTKEKEPLVSCSFGETIAF